MINKLVKRLQNRLRYLNVQFVIKFQTTRSVVTLFSFQSRIFQRQNLTMQPSEMVSFSYNLWNLLFPPPKPVSRKYCRSHNTPTKSYSLLQLAKIRDKFGYNRYKIAGLVVQKPTEFAQLYANPSVVRQRCFSRLKPHRWQEL